MTLVASVEGRNVYVQFREGDLNIMPSEGDSLYGQSVLIYGSRFDGIGARHYLLQLSGLKKLLSNSSDRFVSLDDFNEGRRTPDGGLLVRRMWSPLSSSRFSKEESDVIFKHVRDLSESSAPFCG